MCRKFVWMGILDSWSWSSSSSLEATLQRTMTICVASFSVGDLGHGHRLFSFPLLISAASLHHVMRSLFGQKTQLTEKQKIPEMITCPYNVRLTSLALETSALGCKGFFSSTVTWSHSGVNKSPSGHLRSLDGSLKITSWSQFVPPYAVKLVLFARFCTGGQGARSRRSKNLLEGAMFPHEANASSSTLWREYDLFSWVWGSPTVRNLEFRICSESVLGCFRICSRF